MQRHFRFVTKFRQLLSLLLICSAVQMASQHVIADDKDLPIVRVGALQFGTVNWELDVIKRQGLDRQNGYQLEIVPLGSKNASGVALLGGAVDVIVSDWIWVSRLRAENKTHTFVPYSLIVGRLYAHPDSGIQSLADIVGKDIGIAGGPVDKNWLLLRAYSLQKYGWDLNERAEKKFVAPPLLNQLIVRGDVSSALTFWHYGARLESAGMRPVIDIQQVMQGLGVPEAVPLLGWVFDENWASQNPEVINGLIKSSYAAKRLLQTSDELWETLRPMMKAKDERTFKALKRGYLEGVPKQFGEVEQKAAERTFAIVAELGGKELVGKSKQLSAGTFWQGFVLEP